MKAYRLPSGETNAASIPASYGSDTNRLRTRPHVSTIGCAAGVGSPVDTNCRPRNRYTWPLASASAASSPSWNCPGSTVRPSSPGRDAAMRSGYPSSTYSYSPPEYRTYWSPENRNVFSPLTNEASTRPVSASVLRTRPNRPSS